MSRYIGGYALCPMFFPFFMFFLFFEIPRVLPERHTSGPVRNKKETKIFKKRNNLFNKKKKPFAVIAKVSSDTDI